MNILLKMAIVSCVLVGPVQFAAADEYTTGDGSTVGCNGYDSSGNWVPCPADSSNSSSNDGSSDSSSSSLTDQYNSAKDKLKNMTNPDNWTNDNQQ